MIKAFFQAVLIIVCLGIAAGLGFFGGVHLAPMVKAELVDLSDLSPELIEKHRDAEYLQKEAEQARIAAPIVATAQVELNPDDCASLPSEDEVTDPNSPGSEDKISDCAAPESE